MYWKEIRRSDHYDNYHSNVLDWYDVIKHIHLCKSKRKKGDCIEIEDDRVYILCRIKDSIMYVINVKLK